MTSTPTASLARSLGLGRLAYLAWHAPLAALQRCRREGGPLNQARTRLGRARMEACARRLAVPYHDPQATPLTVHLLTGRRFWYQSAFCLWTLSARSRRPVAPVIHDDGSLSEEQAGILSGLFPRARFDWHEEAEERLQDLLPQPRHPTLHRRWSDYPNIRKLLNVHLGSKEPCLVLDSDMLFFRQPEALLAWTGAPQGRALVAEDCEENYGYPRALLETLAGRPLPARVNVGICGLDSKRLDWSELEDWCERLEAEAGTSYYLEQALVALLLAREPFTQLPAADYRTFPSAPEAAAPSAVLHHFVDLSKAAYFRTSWKLAVTSTGARLP